MTTNPYSADSTSPSLSPNDPSHNRPSYANVAAGSTASSLSAARMNTLQAFTTFSNTLASSQRQPTRQTSRSSLRSMEVDAPSGNTVWKRPTSSWSNDGGRLNGRMGCQLHDEHPPFFTPSYLRQSRHVKRLEKAWNEHVVELRANMQMNPPPPRQPSLSTSSSNANLNKMHSPHTHRGVVQDVIERIPPPVEEDKSHPLPSKFNEDDRQAGIEILTDGSEVRFTGVTKSNDEAASVRSDHPMPRECGLYYFEVTILSRSKEACIGVGFSSRKASLNRFPGWEPDSWAYHGDDGYSFANTPNGKTYGPKFRSQDTIGCGVNFRTGTAFFTKNGANLGVAFSGIKPEKLYPSVGMKKTHDHVRVNFGRHPFVFDIDRIMEQERQIVMSEIRAADISSLYPSSKEDELIHSLISQYLAHEGYVETAKAFAQDVNNLHKSVSEDSRSLRVPNAEDDVHAANRQKIRKAILDGDIDKALKFTTAFYPHILDEDRNRDIQFKLRCRKFIEMMRRYTELSAATSPSAISKSVDSLSSNGHVEGGIDLDDNAVSRDPTDTQMELDEQLHREASRTLPDDVEMETSQELPSKASFMKQNELLGEALSYGQELQSAFGSDPRPQVKKQLSDIFAIMAYTNPTESVVGGLMDPQGRVQIAEDLNRAILVSLGKPASSALEKVSGQAEAFMDAASSKSGGAAAAFVNVKHDFLRP